MKFQKNHIKFQKSGGKKLEFQKNLYQIPKSGGKNWDSKNFILNSKKVEAAGARPADGLKKSAASPA